MDILEMIREDHDSALDAIHKLDKRAESTSDAAATRAMVRDLVVAVKLHSKSEEVGLYQSIASSGKQLRDFTLEAYNEHGLLDSMLDKLLALEPGDDGELKAALKVCKDLIDHHGKLEEERQLFPKLKKAFSADELMAMGATMQAEKELLRAKIMAEVEKTASARSSRASHLRGKDGNSTSDERAVQ